MYCKNCGTENKDDAKFCVSCGSRLEHKESSNGSFDWNKPSETFNPDSTASYNSTPSSDFVLSIPVSSSYVGGLAIFFIVALAFISISAIFGGLFFTAFISQLIGGIADAEVVGSDFIISLFTFLFVFIGIVYGLLIIFPVKIKNANSGLSELESSKSRDFAKYKKLVNSESSSIVVLLVLLSLSAITTIFAFFPAAIVQIVLIVLLARAYSKVRAIKNAISAASEVKDSSFYR
jgi:hypothetical protein